MAADIDQLRGEAERALGAVAVSDPQPLSGGASRFLYGFDARLADGSEVPLVLLVTKGTARQEFEALGAAHAAGVPVAEPICLTDDARGVVMRRLQGEAVAPRIYRQERFAAARGVLLAELGGALAGIHAVAPEDVPSAPRHAGALGEIEEIEAELASYGDPQPALELGLRWLRQRLPPERPPALVHGDFRMGNMLVDEQGLAAVLDWELVHVGDPVEDLGWLCSRTWRYGRDELPAAGLGSREDLLAAYRAAGGSDVAPEELRFWETLGLVRWGVHTKRQLHEHLSGQRPSLELAAIGRRTSEAEWDLLGIVS